MHIIVLYESNMSCVRKSVYTHFTRSKNNKTKAKRKEKPHNIKAPYSCCVMPYITF